MARLIGEEQVVAAADMLVANTDDEAKQLIDLYDADPGRVEVVHPGVDLSTFRDVGKAGARERLGLPADGPLITFVGRIQPLKAPDVMLRAVAVLLERRPELRSTLTVAVVGGPPAPAWSAPTRWSAWPRSSASTDRCGSCLRSPRTSWSTGTPPRRWCASRRTTRASGWSPSRRRPPARRWSQPRSAGSPRPCRNDHSGLLVDDHEPASYAAAFERVLLEPGLRDRLAAGAEQHAQQFGWDRTADMMLGVYAEAQQKMRADLSGIAL